MPGRRRRVAKAKALLGGGCLPMSALIEVRGLSKSFGAATVLHSVDVEVRAGEILTILGQSGGGKSTLLRCINLLEIPDGGNITIASQTGRRGRAGRGQGPRAPASAGGDGLPEVQPVPPPDRDRERDPGADQGGGHLRGRGHRDARCG